MDETGGGHVENVITANAGYLAQATTGRSLFNFNGLTCCRWGINVKYIAEI